MRNTDHIEYFPGGREEHLAEITDDWPYVMETAELDRYPQRTCAWHWHREIELFYVERGEIEYRTRTTRRSVRFPEGSAGFVNCGVLHMTTALSPGTVQRLHIFRPELLGDGGGRIYRRHIAPVVDDPSIDLLAWMPESPGDRIFIKALAESFRERGDGRYGELEVHDRLSRLWIDVLERVARTVRGPAPARMSERDVRFEEMIECIRSRFAEQLRVADIAAAAATSERTCFRTFKSACGMSPLQYLRDYRVEQSCRLLAYTTRPVSAVAVQCGFATASQFGAAFRSIMGCTPSAYRAKWQKSDSAWQEEV